MSKPRYKWWGYVKWCVADYPAKCAELAEMSGIGVPKSDGLPHSHEAQRTTENIALGKFSGQREREYEAVRKAIEITRRRKDGTEVLKLIDLVFWKRSHTLSGAALKCCVSYRTACEWHGFFIRLTAKQLGYLD